VKELNFNGLLNHWTKKQMKFWLRFCRKKTRFLAAEMEKREHGIMFGCVNALMMFGGY